MSSPSLSPSSHNVTIPQPSTLLQSFSPPPASPLHQFDLPPFPRPALLSYPQQLPFRLLALQTSPPNYEASISPPPSNFVGEVSAEGGFNGQSTILGILLSVLLIVILIALIICFRKREKDVPLNSDRSPPSPPNDGLFAAPSPQRLQGARGNPTPRNVTFSPQLSNNVNSSPSTEIQGNNHAPHFCGGNFTLDDLAIATNCFSAENFLGESESGCVHKGVLPTQRRIAVKRLKMGSRQGMHELFEKEVEVISRVHHKHLVSLIGYSVIQSSRFLVYELVPNNNLEFHLHGMDQPVMKWATRRRIAIASAKGLTYLHEDCYPSIIHLRIKASNVLLDSDFEAKVSDFGLAKFFSGTNDDDDDDGDDSDGVPNILTGIKDSGYRAPENAKGRRGSNKSDVFSYGVILLELITGRKPLDKRNPLISGPLVSWARPLLPKALETKDFDGLADPRLEKDYDIDEMAVMVACAAACIRNSERSRPLMSEILPVLEGDIPWSNLREGTAPGPSTSYGPRRFRFFN